MFSTCHLFFVTISHKGSTFSKSPFKFSLFTHNKLLNAGIDNMQEYALVYNCSSWALIVDCYINPRIGFRYYNYIGGFLHLCFADFLLHLLIIFVQYSCTHCFRNFRWTIGNVVSFGILWLIWFDHNWHWIWHCGWKFVIFTYFLFHIFIEWILLKTYLTIVKKWESMFSLKFEHSTSLPKGCSFNIFLFPVFSWLTGILVFPIMTSKCLHTCPLIWWDVGLKPRLQLV